ncbi:MAG: efflux transporter outer membrane subunit, partial [Verrucomicrobia bacterium]|nr:efflux transporter outer membrane subunit [Verrucomicrobiota bacterium]
DQALSEAGISRAARLPDAGVGLQAQRQRTGPTFGYNYLNNYQLGINLSWELDLWGRLANEHQAARALVEASAADYEAARLSLVAQVSKSWFNLKEAHAQTQLSLKTARSYRKNLETLEARYERGLGDSLELRQLRTEVANAEATLQSRRRAAHQASRNLELVLGRYPAAELKANAQLPELAQPVPAGIPTELLERRPDLQAAKARVQAAEKTTRAKRKVWLPALSLTGSGGTASTEFENLLDSDFRIGSMLGNLTLPLFQGGRIKANVQRAESLLSQAEANYHNIALRAFLEVENALSAEHFLKVESEKLRRANTEASAAESLAWERYQNGTIEFINVLISQRAAAQARSRYINILNQRLQNRIDCLLALGGSFEPSL